MGMFMQGERLGVLDNSLHNNTSACVPLGEKEQKVVHSYSRMLLISPLGKRCVEHSGGPNWG